MHWRRRFGSSVTLRDAARHLASRSALERHGGSLQSLSRCSPGDLRRGSLDRRRGTPPHTAHATAPTAIGCHTLGRFEGHASVETTPTRVRRQPAGNRLDGGRPRQPRRTRACCCCMAAVRRATPGVGRPRPWPEPGATRSASTCAATGRAPGSRVQRGLQPRSTLQKTSEHVVAQFAEPPPILVGASLGGLTSLLLAGERSTGLPRAAVVLVDVAPRIEQEGADRITAFMLARSPRATRASRRSPTPSRPIRATARAPRNLEGAAQEPPRDPRRSLQAGTGIRASSAEKGPAELTDHGAQWTRRPAAISRAERWWCAAARATSSVHRGRPGADRPAAPAASSSTSPGRVTWWRAIATTCSPAPSADFLDRVACRSSRASSFGRSPTQQCPRMGHHHSGQTGHSAAHPARLHAASSSHLGYTDLWSLRSQRASTASRRWCWHRSGRPRGAARLRDPSPPSRAVPATLAMSVATHLPGGSRSFRDGNRLLLGPHRRGLQRHPASRSPTSACAT